MKLKKKINIGIDFAKNKYYPTYFFYKNNKITIRILILFA
jgi:hypothetical protein